MLVFVPRLHLSFIPLHHLNTSPNLRRPSMELRRQFIINPSAHRIPTELFYGCLPYRRYLFAYPGNGFLLSKPPVALQLNYRLFRRIEYTASHRIDFKYRYNENIRPNFATNGRRIWVRITWYNSKNTPALTSPKLGYYMSTKPSQDGGDIK